MILYIYMCIEREIYNIIHIYIYIYIYISSAGGGGRPGGSPGSYYREFAKGVIAVITMKGAVIGSSHRELQQ